MGAVAVHSVDVYSLSALSSVDVYSLSALSQAMVAGRPPLYGLCLCPATSIHVQQNIFSGTIKEQAAPRYRIPRIHAQDNTVDYLPTGLSANTLCCPCADRVLTEHCALRLPTGLSANTLGALGDEEFVLITRGSLNSIAVGSAPTSKRGAMYGALELARALGFELFRKGEVSQLAANAQGFIMPLCHF